MAIRTCPTCGRVGEIIADCRKTITDEQRSKAFDRLEDQQKEAKAEERAAVRAGDHAAAAIAHDRYWRILQRELRLIEEGWPHDEGEPVDIEDTDANAEGRGAYARRQP